jgi:hypothetical protein
MKLSPASARCRREREKPSRCQVHCLVTAICANAQRLIAETRWRAKRVNARHHAAHFSPLPLVRQIERRIRSKQIFN